ncbi:LamG-like jellyroll fold domain-containing protein [Streptomyces sp. NPDC047981]|uniref:LamG-like jellyroll fold domain-containing protein n=1 Tax=Streptomyces sp. NPDC047981 TaxID=3154610 RepID=UPI003413436D
MRSTRTLVLLLAFCLAVLAGIEYPAQAFGRWAAAQARPGPGPLPHQDWGSARGRAHHASGDTTDSLAPGGRKRPLTAPGELPADAGTAAVRLPGEPKPPASVPFSRTTPPRPAEGGRTAPGFDAEASVEVAGERRENARTFSNPDGTFTTRFYNEPVNHRTPNGSWTPIDNRLVAQPSVAGGAAPKTGADAKTGLSAGSAKAARDTAAVPGSAAGWQTRSTTREVRFAEHADARTLVRIGTGDRTAVGYGVEGAAHTRGRAEGNTVTYAGIRPSADLELAAGDTGAKETLVLRAADAPTRWRFPLDLQGLTARLDGHGGVAFIDAQGKERARMPAGWMEDAKRQPGANQGVVSDGVRYGLAEEAGRQILVVTLDDKWLRAPERVFPVRVDPSVTGVQAASGTYVQHPYTTNFSTDTLLKAGTYDGGGHKAASFLRFNGLNTGSLKNAWVIDAKLALYNTWSYSCTARPVTVHQITSNWSESTTSSWPGPSTGPALGSKSFAHGWRPEGSTGYPCGPAAWEAVSLGAAGRQLVDDWTHGRKPHYGLAVKASATDSKSWKQFGSDDYPNGKPSLDITWSKYGATYQLGSFVTPMTATSEGTFKVTVTNRGQQTWPKDGNIKLRYDLYDSAGKLIGDWGRIRWTPMPEDVPPGSSVTLDAKIAPLAPATYTLVWTMDDYGVTSFAADGVPGAAMRFEAVNIPPYLTGAAPPSGTVTDTLTPTLWASAADKDRHPGALTHQFEICEVEGKDARKNCRSSTPGPSQSWTVPSGWLSWFKTYAWYAYAHDGKDRSARPGPALLTTQVPQPAITSHLGGSDSGRSFGERAGNYVTAATDAAVPTIGPELAVTRTYNSQDPRTTNVFGAGWATRWDMRAAAEGDGSVVVTSGDGAQIRFGRNTDGSYSAPSGSLGVLTSATGGGWTLRDASAALYTFDASGRLTRVKDGHSREQELTYTAGRLTRATDVTSGRSLSFTWEGEHVAAASTDAVGPLAPALTWTYSYTGDLLTKVCPPASTTRCTEYGYTAGSHARSLVLDANPTSFWRLDETDGENAASQAVSRTGRNAARYRDVTLGAAGAPAGTGNKAASFDGTDSHVELPDTTLSGSTVLSVELWFKTTKPGVLVGFQNKALEDTKPGYYNPVLAVDGAGRLRGAFEQSDGWFAPLGSTDTVTDDAWHHAVLASTGTSQTLYLDGTAVGTRSGPVHHFDKTYTYLGAGYSKANWDGISPEGVRHFTGLMDDVAVYQRALDPATVRAHHAARTGTAKLSRVTLPSGRTGDQVVYDTDSERTTQVTDARGGTWSVSAPTYAAGSQAYADAVLGSGPVSYWRLGDTSGVAAADEVSSGGNGAYRDGVTLGQTGAFLDGDDAAITLDGTTGAVDFPAEPLAGDTALTVELWFRTDKADGVLTGLQNAELGATPTAWNPSLLIDGAGKLRGKLWNGVKGTAVVTPAAVTDNKWHHAALTGGPAGQTLYLDGAKVGSLPGAIKAQTVAQAYLGAGYANPDWDGRPAGTRYFSGQLDEAALYSKELTAASVADHYKARTRLTSGSGDQYRGAVTGASPAGYWSLDETAGTTVTSRVAANAGHGTYTKAVLGSTGAFGPGDGSAVRFDGDGHAELPALTTTSGDVSVGIWFRTGKPGVLVSDQSAPIAGATAVTGSWTPVLYVGVDGKLHGEYYSSGAIGASNASAATVTDNEWHHAVITAKSGTQTLYLDGAQVATKTGAPVNHQSNSRTYLGAGFAKSWPSSPGDISHFTGELDEAAVYRHALTAEQVADQYKARAFAAGSTLSSTITVTDPTGAKTANTYDEIRGRRRTATTDADGGLTTYGYDTGGFLRTVTDPNGHTTTTGHDERGNAVSSTTCRDADSCWTSFIAYHHNAADPLDLRNGKPTEVRDARSSGPADNRYRTTTTYTPLGLTDTVTLADGRTSRTAYTDGSEPAVGGGSTPSGLVATARSAGGATVSYAYYANGDLARTTAPSGHATTYTYDGIGRKLTETQISDAHPNGVTTSYAYDTRSRISSETGPGVKNEITGVTHTARISRTYDADGLLLSESTEDTTGGDATRTTTYRYNTLGLNDGVTDAAGNESAFVHDALGRVVRESDPAGNVVTHAFTKRGRLAESVLKDWTGDPSGETRDLVLVSHAYDPAGRLAATTDAMGATTAYTYYDDGLTASSTAKQVTQSDGSKKDVVLGSTVYDGAGNAVSQTASGGRTTVSTVDATGRVTRSVFDPNGLNRVTTAAYDADDRVTESTQSVDASGRRLTSTTEYDAAGNPTKETLTDGTTTRVTSGTFDQRGLPLTQVTPRGNTGTARYDVLGRLVETTAPPVQAEENGGAAAAVTPRTLVGYNTFGEATEARDTRGLVSRTETDKLGRAVAVTLPDYTPPGASAPITAVTRTTYDQLGNVASTTDPLGRTRSYQYDQLGHLVRATDPAVTGGAQGLQASRTASLDGTATALSGGGVFTYTWTPTGLPLSVTDPTGARTESTYDELGRKLSGTTVERKPTPQNLVSRFTWDDAGNQVASTTPGGRVTTATYDKAGQTLTVTDPAGGVSSSVYDGLGRQTEGKDATGRRTVTAYDLAGSPVSVTDYGTGTTALRTSTTEYDADGNVTASVSATGARRTYTYDALGRTTKQVEPVTATDSITTTFGYDAAGNRTRLTDGRGKVTYYTFNVWGLPESTIEPSTAQHSSPANRTWTNVYDAAGRVVTELLPGNVKRKRTYDELDRLTGETGSGTAAATRPRSLSYDLAGRMTGAGGDGILAGNTYAYNDRGQLLSSEGPGGSSSYAYDADGRMTSRTDVAGTTAFTYDAGGRLDTTTDPLTGTRVRSEYDAAGRPTAQEYARPAADGTWSVGSKRSYTYDALGRLADDSLKNTGTGAAVQGTSYAYDLDNRMVRKTTTGTAGAGERTYGYDLAGRMTSETAGGATTAFTWDKAGNLTKKGDITATYDSRNRVQTWGTQTFDYSARGTLQGVTDTNGPSRSVSSDAFERTVGNGTSTFTYDSLDRVMTGGENSFSYDGASNDLVRDGTSTYSRAPGGSLLASAVTGSADSARLAVTDRHTDVIASLSADGTSVTSSRAYDSFGNVTASAGANPSLGYQSGWTDASTGEVNMAARWYQPGTGGFTSRDTWQLDPDPSVQANRYTYANASPMNGIDPTGHSVLDCFDPRPRLKLSWWLRKASGPVRCTFFEAYVAGHDSIGDVGASCNANAWERARCARGRGEISKPSPAPSGPPSGYSFTRGFRKGFSGSWNSFGNFARNYRPGSYSHGSGYGGGRSTAHGGGGGGGTRTPVRSTKPPKPAVPQNVNRGKNPPIAPTHLPRIAWDTAAGTATTLSASQPIAATITAQALLDAAAVAVFAPAVTDPMDGRPATDTDQDDSRDCRRNGEGWRELGDLDTAQGSRATGIEACLTKEWIEAHPGSETDPSVRPPGYKWAYRYAKVLGNRDSTHMWRNACHLLAKTLGGSGRDLRNLSTCSRAANAAPNAPGDPGKPVHMETYEGRVSKAVKKEGQVVHYRVTPHYEGPRTVPTTYRMQATGYHRDGSPGVSFDVTIENEMFSLNDRKWRNIGRVTDPRIRGPVPFGPGD